MASTSTEQTAVEADLLRADEDRFEAMRRGDWAAVYAHAGGRWRMVAWQSTRQPDA